MLSADPLLKVIAAAGDGKATSSLGLPWKQDWKDTPKITKYYLFRLCWTPWIWERDIIGQNPRFQHKAGAKMTYPYQTKIHIRCLKPADKWWIMFLLATLVLALPTDPQTEDCARVCRSAFDKPEFIASCIAQLPPKPRPQKVEDCARSCRSAFDKQECNASCVAQLPPNSSSTNGWGLLQSLQKRFW